MGEVDEQPCCSNCKEYIFNGKTHTSLLFVAKIQDPVLMEDKTIKISAHSKEDAMNIISNKYNFYSVKSLEQVLH